MSYVIKIKATDGTAVIASVSGQLPDGEFEITGYEDLNIVTISARRRDAKGRFRAGAANSHYTREALEMAEALAELG